MKIDSEKVKEIKEALELNEYFAIEYFSKSGDSKIFTFTDLLILINEFEDQISTLNAKKIPEDSVVLSREEYSELKGRAEEVFNEMTERMKAEVKIAKKMGIVKGSKETAEKILKDIMFCIDINDCNKNEMLILNLCKMLAKQFGVEVKV